VDGHGGGDEGAHPPSNADYETDEVRGRSHSRALNFVVRTSLGIGFDGCQPLLCI
jgi:hypothetical protein